jgi:hypothetical protein
MVLKTETLILDGKEYVLKEMSYADELNFLDFIENNTKISLAEKQEFWLSLIITPYEKGFLASLSRKDGRELSAAANKLNYSPIDKA